MSETPLVTVAVPFYNNERTLLNTIRSVLAQSLEDWEMILADDGSPDGSLQVAQSVQDPRIRVISDGRNLKVAARRNQITREARGKYIAVLDADDLMHPDRLKRQIELLEARPEVDVVGTQMYMIDSQYRIYGISTGSLAVLATRDFKPAETLGPQIVIHGTATGKAEWFRQNPYDETWARFIDSELWCRTCRTSKFAQIEEPLYYVEVTDENVMAKRARALGFRRRLIKMYGPEFVGQLGTMKLLAEMYYKYAAYRVYGTIRKSTGLMQRWARPLTAEQQAEAEAGLAKLLATEIPTR
ncbi:MAG: glycosyltransferase family 2 protein [Armatimonadia bacterium]